MASACSTSTSSSPTVSPRPIPPSRKYTNIARGRRLPARIRSTMSSLGFSAARPASPKNNPIFIAVWPVLAPCALPFADRPEPSLAIDPESRVPMLPPDRARSRSPDLCLLSGVKLPALLAQVVAFQAVTSSYDRSAGLWRAPCGDGGHGSALHRAHFLRHRYPHSLRPHYARPEAASPDLGQIRQA